MKRGYIIAVNGRYFDVHRAIAADIRERRDPETDTDPDSEPDSD